MAFWDKFKKKKTDSKDGKAKDAGKVKPVNKDDKEKKQKDEYKTLQPKGQGPISPVPVKEKDVKEKKIVKSKEDTKNAYKVLIRPLITEKATDLGSVNKYCFEVSPRTNKVEVKKAIQSLYGVEPIAVNIMNMRGKRVRYGRITGKRRNWKKAVVTLKQGERIELYEGV